MLGTKDILMGADTGTPALDDFAKLVATELPAAEQVDCQNLAITIMNAALRVKNDRESCHEAYPQLYHFLKKGGNMMTLSAKMNEVIAARASKAYAENYQTVSKLFFGQE